MDKLTLSPLGHTWILDLDGTIVKHNGYKLDGIDTFLEGAEQFLKNIPKTDKIIFLTSRTNEFRGITESFLEKNDIHYSEIIYNMPFGERILINDAKPSGLKTAIALNVIRDCSVELQYEIDDSL